MDEATMEEMTKEQTDNWFKEVDRASAEYQLFLQLIIDDSQDPVFVEPTCENVTVCPFESSIFSPPVSCEKFAVVPSSIVIAIIFVN
jgi:hypothetical protein